MGKVQDYWPGIVTGSVGIGLVGFVEVLSWNCLDERVFNPCLLFTITSLSKLRLFSREISTLSVKTFAY